MNLHIQIRGQVIPLSSGEFSWVSEFLINGKVQPESRLHSTRKFSTREIAEENLKLWAGFLSEMLREQIKEEHGKRQASSDL